MRHINVVREIGAATVVHSPACRKRCICECGKGGTVSPVDKPVIAFGDCSRLRPAGLLEGCKAQRKARFIDVERFQPTHVELPVAGHEKIGFAAAAARRNAELLNGQERWDTGATRPGVDRSEDRDRQTQIQEKVRPDQAGFCT